MDAQNMKAVLRQTGLTADRLRIWEKRYGAVRPQRSENGRRVYRAEEVQRLRLLADLVRGGHAIGKIAGMSDEELVKLGGASRVENGDDRLALDTLIGALEKFELAAMRSSLSRLRYSVSPRAFAFQVVPEMMFLVGKLIRDGKISIAQEHALSEIIQQHLRRIYEDLESLEGSGRNGESLIFCTREGDPHDFGLMLAAIACRYRGFKTHYIGRNLPASPLFDAVSKLRPTAVVVGMTTLPPELEKISPAHYIAALDSGLPNKTEIWLGGTGATDLPRPKSSRDIWIFESLTDLEEKIQARGTPSPRIGKEKL